MQAVVIGQKWKATNQKPQHGACNQIDGLDRTSVKDTRTCPCHRERGEKQGIGEIDADQIGDLPVHTKQRNRGKPQQMREDARSARFCAQTKSSNRPRMASM